MAEGFISHLIVIYKYAGIYLYYIYVVGEHDIHCWPTIYKLKHICKYEAYMWGCSKLLFLGMEELCIQILFYMLIYFIWKQCILTFFTMYRGWWKHRWSGQFWGDFHEAISKPNNPFISHWTVSFIIFFWSWWTKAGNIYLNV